MPSFEVGDHVKCIDTKGVGKGVFDELSTYVIEEPIGDGGFVFIRGINLKSGDSGFRWAWSANRFVLNYRPEILPVSFSEYLDAITGGKDA